MSIVVTSKPVQPRYDLTYYRERFAREYEVLTGKYNSLSMTRGMWEDANCTFRGKLCETYFVRVGFAVCREVRNLLLLRRYSI